MKGFNFLIFKHLEQQPFVDLLVGECGKHLGVDKRYKTGHIMFTYERPPTKMRLTIFVVVIPKEGLAGEA